MARTYVLPDERILSASVLDVSGGETPSLGPLWELWLTPGAQEEVSVGHPLNSTLADLLGYDVAHEEWPAWIDELADRITADCDTET
jgi:hypothetical protein